MQNAADMKNFNFLTRLAGLALVGLTSIFGWGAPAPPVLRTPMTTNSSTGAPVNGDVPTFDLATQKWTFAAPPGASGGEANVGANDGAGAGVYASKVGITLHFNTLTNGNSYLTISSNSSLLTLSVVGLQPTNNNLTLLSAFGPTTWQATNANLTLLQAFGPTTWQATNANLTLLQSFGPTTWQATNANLTLLQAYGPTTWQATNGVLTLLESLTDPNANRIVMWDDTDNAFVNATVGANLTYTHASHTLSSAAGGTGSTNIDYGSANTYTISNSLSVLGTMTLSELDVAEIIVTNNIQGSNVIANVALIAPKLMATNGANLILAVNSTNVATASGSSGIMDFVKTPTVGGNPVLTNASGAAQSPWTGDINAAGYKLTNVASISGGGAGTSWVFNASVNVATNVTTLNFIATNGLSATNLNSPVGGARLSFGVGTTNDVMYISGSSGNTFVNYGLEVVGVTTADKGFLFPLTTTWTAHDSGSNYVVDVSLPRLHFNMTTNLNIIHATNGTANFAANTAQECAIKVINNSGTNFPVTFPSTWKCYGNAVSNHICWLTNGDWLTMAIQFSGSSTDQTNIDAAVAYRSPGT